MIREVFTTVMGGALLACLVPAHAAAASADHEAVVLPRVGPKVMLPGDTLRGANSHKAPSPKRNSAAQSGRGQSLPHPFREQVAQPEARA